MSEITHEISLDNFHHQINWVLKNYCPHGLKSTAFNQVVIGGLGGSGIGGRIARLAMISKFPIPVEVFSSYELPGYADSKTLVILCSYSGNTEETLAMYAEAKSKGCRMICMASSGKIMQQAQQDQIPCYLIETGYQPRMTLGYSLSTLLLMLAELSGNNVTDELKSTANMLLDNGKLKEEAHKITDLFGKTINHKFVVVCDPDFEAVAVRFCQQIQENAKGESFVTVLPEANHNVIESYQEKHDTNFILLNSGNNTRTNLRFEFLNRLLTEKHNLVYSFPESGSGIQRLFEIIHILDWVSIYASNLRRANNMRVDIIMRLKGFLDSVK
ncbi:MAG: SIS domain-containing protein [Bacteroidetes bacterium]|jgi:glucose/mannose-6-phosphate isomerase|nr:SIS domain-containing protein [Bacteroidota bacterium]